MCRGVVWAAGFPATKRMGADAIGDLPVGHRLASGGRVHDRCLADASSGLEFRQPVRDDLFLDRGILLPGTGDGPNLAGARHVVPVASLFLDIRRPGAERTGVAVFD